MFIQILAAGLLFVIGGLALNESKKKHADKLYQKILFIAGMILVIGGIIVLILL